MTKQKLIDHYQKKVDILNQGIENLTAALKEARALKNEDDIEEFSQEIDGAVNRWQIHFQFIKDLEDLEL